MKGIFEKKEVGIVARKVDGFRSFPPMFHTHVEVLYVLRGEISMMIDGTAKTLSPGEISISFPYSIHSYENAPDAEIIMLLFSPAAAGNFEKTLLSYKAKNPYIQNGEAVLPLLHKLVEYCEKEGELYEKAASAYLSAVVGELLLSLSLIRLDNMDINVAQQILSYCSSHYNEAISVKNVANALYLSESYVTKTFSGKLGYSFREYINTLRIAEAKNLLKNTNMKIIDVMYTCGFTNQSSFNRIFQEMTSVTPKVYREQNRK